MRNNNQSWSDLLFRDAFNWIEKEAQTRNKKTVSKYNFFFKFLLRLKRSLEEVIEKKLKELKIDRTKLLHDNFK